MAWREPAPGAPMAGEREEKRASTKAAALQRCEGLMSSGVGLINSGNLD